MTAESLKEAVMPQAGPLGLSGPVSAGTHRLRDAAASQAVGLWLGRALVQRQATAPPWIITLDGELGTGKTTVARAVLQGLGHSGTVPSPTYTLAEHYPLACANCWHLDMYRLAKQADVQALGLEEMLTADKALLLVEWPDRIACALPQSDLCIRLFHRPEGGRSLHLAALSARAKRLF